MERVAAHRLKIGDVRRLCSDAILLVGTTRMQTVQFGTAKALHNIFMMVWARGKDGVWRMASWQSTVIPGWEANAEPRGFSCRSSGQVPQSAPIILISITI